VPASAVEGEEQVSATTDDDVITAAIAAHDALGDRDLGIRLCALVRVMAALLSENANDRLHLMDGIKAVQVDVKKRALLCWDNRDSASNVH